MLSSSIRDLQTLPTNVLSLPFVSCLAWVILTHTPDLATPHKAYSDRFGKWVVTLDFIVSHHQSSETGTDGFALRTLVHFCSMPKTCASGCDVTKQASWEWERTVRQASWGWVWRFWERPPLDRKTPMMQTLWCVYRPTISFPCLYRGSFFKYCKKRPSVCYCVYICLYLLSLPHPSPHPSIFFLSVKSLMSSFSSPPDWQFKVKRWHINSKGKWRSGE